MSIDRSELCEEVETSIADVLEGTAPARVIDHVATCDHCRDFRYEAEQAALAMQSVGADFHPTDGFAERMIGLVLEARPDGPQPASTLGGVASRVSGTMETPTSGAQPKTQVPWSDASGSDPHTAAMVSAPTQLAPSRDELVSGAVRDPNATVLEPANRTMIASGLSDAVRAVEGGVHKTLAGGDEVEPRVARTQIEAEPRVIDPNATTFDPNVLGARVGAEGSHGETTIDPYVPTHKTLPLSAVMSREASPTIPSAGAALTPMPPEREAIPHVVEATTGRNITGARGRTSDTAPGPEARPMTKGFAGPTAVPAGPTLNADAATTSAPVRIARPQTTAPVVSLFRKRGFIAALVGGMAAAAAVGGFLIKGHGASDTVAPPVVVADGAWSGTVQSVSRAAADGGSGFEVCKETCKPAAAGVAFEPGSTLKTDSKTRARVKLSDDTWIAIDRGSEITLPAGETRQAKLERGLVVADVTHIEGGKPATFQLPQGEVKVIGTKVALTVAARRSSVEVVRGEVDVTSKAGSSTARVRAGEEATLADQGEPVVASKTTMSDMLAWSSESADDVDAPALRGVGELRAKKLGQQQERVGAVRLTKHNVKVRISDIVARTEVDETFTNTTDEELEGIFRFPLPPGAQIESLSLEVDGKLVQGAFEERGRAAAIFRGAEQNATPKAPKPKEEIIWVPGPWHDPALLEWQRGGRFELKIFPIPKKGSRRVVLTYTQTVPQSAGVRRFTYPLAHDASGSTKIDDFNVDLQVVDHDAAFGVEARGYQLTKAQATGGAERFALSEKSFVPAGDLVVEYALPSRTQELTAWAYALPASASAASTPPVVTSAPTGSSTDKSTADKAKAADLEAKALADDRSAYVALAVRPKLPRFPEGKERLHVIVVDSSRSMVGERFARATRLAASVVREMDRRDEFILLACDTTCQAMGATESRTLPAPLEPSTETAQQVESFLGSIEPDGGSNLLAAVQAARTAAGARGGRELRILYLGDGTPTVGPTRPSTIEAAVRHILPSSDGSVVAVALGSDADTTSLGALARGGNGVVVPYVPGQRVSAAAVDVLASAYGSVLSDVEVVLPPGFTEVTPRRLDPIPAGGEAFILARMPSGRQIDGTVTLRGRVGSDRFEQTYQAHVVPSTSTGNAFVPRLFAAAKINELEATGTVDDAPRIVALSKQFHVASRHTSMLVLESDRMFEAFGVRRDGITPVFTGEDRAESSGADADNEEAAVDEPALADKGGGERERSAGPREEKKSKGDFKMEMDDAPAGGGKGAGASMGPAPAPSPAPTAAPMTPPAAEPPRKAPASKPAEDAAEISQQRRKDSGFNTNDPFSPGWDRRPPPRPISRRPMIPMKKVFDRKASFSSDKLLANELVKVLSEAESALKLTPDSRDRTVSLYKAFMASGRTGEALELASKWSNRDALDPDALVARADLAAMNGDRERAIRILSGLADVRPNDKAVQKRLISAFALMGLPDLACQHRLALADMDPQDATAGAAAVRCAQDQGLANVGQALLANAPANLKDKIDTTARSLKLTDLPGLSGDVRVTATWTTPADLDLALIDKNGRRLSWLGSTAQNITVSAKDVSSTSSESLSVAGLSSGNFTVEVVRARGTKATTPISGELTFTLPGGETRRVPFTLTGARTEVGSLRVFFTSRLVPATMGPDGRWR